MRNEIPDGDREHFANAEFDFAKEFERKFVSNLRDYKEFLKDTEIGWLDFCDNSKDFAYISNEFAKYFTRLKTNVVSSCPEREVYMFAVRWFGVDVLFERGDIDEKRLLMVLKLKGLVV